MVMSHVQTLQSCGDLAMGTVAANLRPTHTHNTANPIGKPSRGLAIGTNW